VPESDYRHEPVDTILRLLHATVIDVTITHHPTFIKDTPWIKTRRPNPRYL
jgi:hypothetical protein